MYAQVADVLSSAQAVKTRRGKRSYARAAVRVAEAGARKLSAAVDRSTARFDGTQRNAAVRYYVMRADRAKLARINQLLEEVGACALTECSGGEELLLTILLSPQ